jgi:hypothetical protein
MQHIFATPAQREKTSDPTLAYFAPARVEKLLNVIIALVVFLLLVLPLIALEVASMQKTRYGDYQRVHLSLPQKVGVIAVFPLVFSVAITIMTRATRQELFTASAAYCAVIATTVAVYGA